MQRITIPKNGFTLIELLITVAIFIVMAGGAFAILSSFFNHTQLDTTGAQLLFTFRKAQIHAMNRYRDDAWGVHLDPVMSRFILFKGNTFSGSDASFHEITALPPSLAFNNIALAGGGTAIIFDQLSGATSNPGFFELKSLNSSDQWQWNIAPNGLMEVH